MQPDPNIQPIPNKLFNFHSFTLFNLHCCPPPFLVTFSPLLFPFSLSLNLSLSLSLSLSHMHLSLFAAVRTNFAECTFFKRCEKYLEGEGSMKEKVGEEGKERKIGRDSKKGLLVVYILLDKIH